MKEHEVVQAVNNARDVAATRNVAFKNISLCDALDFVYDVLMELKPKAGFFGAFFIRQVHGLISATRRTMNC